jgi:hypothetical protein
MYAHRHIEFVRDDLLQRRIDAGAEINLAGIDGHFSALVDCQK